MFESEANSVRESYPASGDCFWRVNISAGGRPVGKATGVAIPTIDIISIGVR
jgi:hypothetical protein